MKAKQRPLATVTGPPNKLPFLDKVKIWSDNAASGEFPEWEDQIKLLSEIGDLITPDLTLEEVVAAIYASVNQLMDANQFAVGLYNAEEEVLLYKGMIENNQQYPDVVIDANAENRFAPWCLHNEAEIFINDMDTEYIKYVKTIPSPVAGPAPKAALYVPLTRNGKVSGVITVRSTHKNVYRRHHLYILKTLGTFVMRSVELAERLQPIVKGESEKKWQWCDPEKLSSKSRHLLLELTEREKEVLFLMISGLSNKAMAEKLFVSPGTIKTHTLNIYNKLNVNNRTSAIVKAMEYQWVA